jgi:O-antigen/teichoic acid export membrane protein
VSLKRNVIANYLGQGWSGLIGLAFVPLYIKYLGIEAYGLIGIFALLQAWLTLLDMGMTPTLNREMARFTAGAHTPQSIRDLLRSLEIVCFGVAALIGVLVWAASGWLAADWLRAEKLPIDVVAQAIAIMGGVAAFRFVEGIYRGAILGLQRQVFFNVVNAVLSSVRAVGAITVLAWVSPTIEAFFIWQGVVSIVSIAILAFAAHGSLPTTPQPARFSRQALMDIRHFAGGMMATTFLAILLTQVDKVLLSKLISLEAFGYYTLAGTVVTTIGMLIAPITQAFYPRFTELVANGGHQELVQTYHRSAQLVTVLAAPVALMLIFFAKELLVLWTGNVVLANEVAPILALLAAGTLLNGLMHIPYMLQLAHGWSGFAARVNLVAVAVLVPTILWVTPRYGAIGAAWVWALLNAGYVLIGIHFMYRRLLPDEKWAWYWSDTARPILAATVATGVLSVAQPEDIGKLAEFVWLLAAGLVVVGAAIAVTPNLRASAIHIVFGRMSKNA